MPASARPASDAGTARRSSADDGLFHASIRLGRVAGVQIGLNWSWLLVFLLVTWSLGAAVFPEGNPGLSTATYGAMAGVAAVLFFACLLLHELGHAVRARAEGMELEGITLWLFGGVARKGMFPSAGAEFRIAIAGPRVSLALGVALIAFGMLVPLPAAIDGVVTWLGQINLILLAFNMLPALPLDGGRALRSAQRTTVRPGRAMVPLADTLVCRGRARAEPFRPRGRHREGRLVGLLSITDLSRLLELRRLTAGRDRGGHPAASA